MNRTIKSIAVGVALGCAVSWCVPTNAVASKNVVQTCRTFSVAASTTIGCNPQSANSLKSAPFKTPMSGNFSIFVMCDTTGGAANASDTISIAYQVGVNASVTSEALNWKTIHTMKIPKSSATVKFPMFQMFRDGVGFTVLDTTGAGLAQGLRTADPVIGENLANAHPTNGYSQLPALSTGIGRFVVYGASLDSINASAYAITACFNYED